MHSLTWTRGSTRPLPARVAARSAAGDRSLTERFNEDWFRNPRAGPWMVGQLLNEGQRELADELAARVGGRALSFGPVIEAVERLVA